MPSSLEALEANRKCLQLEAHYQRLLPRRSGEEELRPKAPPPRRRRLVSNACNSCRTRKTKWQSYPTASASCPLLTSPYEDWEFIFEKSYDTDAYYRRVDPSLFVGVSGHDLPLSNWTRVSTDDRRMNHLLNLFFTWDNIVERIIYRPIFEENVRRSRRGNQGDYDDNADSDFCSPFLVSCLLALSCLYSMDLATYKDPGDPKTRGRLWAEEAELHLQNCPRPSIALMQGLYVLLIYEASLGTGARTLQDLARCMDVYRILNDRNMDELTDQTVPEPRRRLESEKLLLGACGEYIALNAYCWYPYPLSLQMQPSMQVAIREADAALSEIVELILNYLHPDENGTDAVSKPGYALELYDALLNWKYGLPDELLFEQSVLPSVIALHIDLETVSMTLLRPFTHMTKQEFGRFSPRERCAAHAGHLVSTVWSFRAHGQVRYEYYLIYALGAAAYVLLQEPDAPVQMDSLVRASVTDLLPVAGGNDNEAKRANLQLEDLLRDFGDVDIH
ncbi:fungal specific transcription factor [Beauveria bassiana ARSEF 2860]|uniref:Fungal specific transcription factor n=1 Tax=Beauveria bassiana (strain ARSEF 2860) TaxID=655819 RepID=J4VTZ7_BEAB2|nr:fungal specific transcription factor [Beauveria bassiana ARSEF 2860]EJP62010.1 fungal specific transcription factor [Beauveria bassiana ARSEF 2860]